MGWNKKVKLWSNERLDLPDVEKLQKNVYNYLGQINSNLLASKNYIVSGFVVQSNGGLNIKVVTKDSVVFYSESTDANLQGTLWVGSGDDSIDLDLTALLSNNTINYVEIEFFEEDSAPDTRALWDPTANSGLGDEFTQVVNTCTTVKSRLRVNSTAWSGNPNYIRLGRVQTGGGSIIAIYDERDLFFRLTQDYSWPNGRSVPSNTSFTGADKSIPTLKDWQDAVMSVIKEMKGAEWYEVVGSGSGANLHDLLQDKNVILSVLGSVEFNSTTSTLSWADDIVIMVPDAGFDFTIPAGSFAGIADQDVLYVVFDRSGAAPILALQKVANGNLSLFTDNYVIGYRRGNDFIFRDGQITNRVWVYEENILIDSDINPGDLITLPVDSRNSNATKYYRSGRAEIEFIVNGIPQNRNKVLFSGVITGATYNSGTGLVSVPDGVDLSNIRRGFYFRDVDNNEFLIYGGVNNELGSKGFLIDVGQTVNTTGNCYIFTQDFIETGIDGSWVNQIQARKIIASGSVLTFRINPITAFGSGTTTGGGGGGSTTLQGAYNTGRTITTTTGNPVEISGPAGQKLFKVNGDMDVSGVVDPKGITLTPQATNPAPGQNCLWLKNTGEMTFSNTISGQDEAVGGGQSLLTGAYGNSSIAQIKKGRVIRKSAATSVEYSDNSSYVNAAAIGISLADTNSGDQVSFQRGGRIPSGIITASCFAENVLPAEGTWIYLGDSEGLLTTSPPVPLSGLKQVFLGVWDNGSIDLRVVPWGNA